MSQYGIDFREFMRANASAFDALGKIRSSAREPGKPDIYSPLEAAVSNIAVMARGYTTMLPKEKGVIRRVFSGAYDNACYVVAQLQAMINAGQQESEEFSRLLSDTYERGLFKLVDSIDPEFDKKSRLDASTVTTLHELLRYLHQRSIEVTFDASMLEGNTSGLSHLLLNQGEFYFMDLDNQVDCTQRQSSSQRQEDNCINREQILCRPAQAILDYYAQQIHTAGSEKYYMFLKKDSVNAHVKINCHSAEIDAKLDGDNSYVRIRYNEYLNANFNGRLDYLSQAMRHLGFDVTLASEVKSNTTYSVKTDAIIAGKSNVDEQSAYATLTELVRLLASSTHINCSLGDNQNYTTDDLLKVFFDGICTNLHEELLASYPTRKDKITSRLRKLPALDEVVKKRLETLGIEK